MSLGQTLLQVLGWEETRARIREGWESDEFTRHNGCVWRALITFYYAFLWGGYGTFAMHHLFELVGTSSAFPIGRITAILGRRGTFLSSFLLVASIVACSGWLLVKRGFAARKRHRVVWCVVGALGMAAPPLWMMACDCLLQSREDLAASLLTQAFCMSLLSLFGATLGRLLYAIAERCAAEHLAECDAAS